ncbi:MAG TPA: PKD domain-containing protein [Chitinophaga sp.]|uniref:PKD domain-containing protein n=1 Tax=Chitinophaga sp. TaxID=1869181 RepID=UPI002DB8C984|nr:PKD domain-containing protein [Chitinophaga sp.]HEU4552370.1 PKD domain-containing protein [Chitinophaga sp.]
MKRLLLLIACSCLAFSGLKAQNFDFKIKATDTIGCAPKKITFDVKASSELSVIDWLWEFGDGGTASGPQPTHTFNTPGHYVVRLTMVVPTGATSMKVFSYQEIDILPILDLGVQHPLCQNYCPIIRNEAMAQGHHDPGWYLWSTGDTTSTLRACSPGTYSVTYNVCGQTITDTTVVIGRVSETMANISYTWLCARQVNLSVVPAYENVPYRLWLNWGDNTSQTLVDKDRHELLFDHEYAVSGDYTIEVHMEYQNSCADIVTRKVTVRQ